LNVSSSTKDGSKKWTIIISSSWIKTFLWSFQSYLSQFLTLNNLYGGSSLTGQDWDLSLTWQGLKKNMQWNIQFLH
jgi:hypothetical protein